MEAGIKFGLLAAIIWGFNFSVSEKLFSKISLHTLLFCEFVIGIIAVYLISGFKTIKPDLELLVDDNKMLVYFISVVCLFSVGMISINSAIKYSNSLIASQLELCYPLFIVLFSYILFNTNYLNFRVLIGGLLVLLGIWLITNEFK